MAGLALAGVVVAGSRDDDTAPGADTEAADDESVTESTTLDTLPDVESSADPEASDDDTADEANEDGSFDDEADGGDSAFVDTLDDSLFMPIAPDYDATPVGWRSSSVRISDRLAGLTPTTVVVLDDNGVVREIDLPSGATREIRAAGRQGFTSSIAVGRSSTMLLDVDSFDAPVQLVHLRPGEPPVMTEVDGPVTQLVEIPGTDAFDALRFDVAASSITRTIIDASGDEVVSEDLPAELSQLVATGLTYGPAGEVVYGEGGSVYAVSIDGTRRLVGTGEVIAASSHHVLLKQCDAAGTCTGRLLDADGAATTTELDADFVGAYSQLVPQVSPDGRFLLYTVPLSANVQLLDLAFGESQVVARTNVGLGGSLNDMWMPDSSGFFRLQGGRLQFFDVATGRLAVVTTALDGLVDFGVRLDREPLPPPPAVSGFDVDLELVVVSPNGDLHDLDLGSGDVTSILADGWLGVSGREIVVTDGDAVQTFSPTRGPGNEGDRSSGTVQRNDASADDSDDTDDMVPTFRGPDNGSVWVASDGSRFVLSTPAGDTDEQILVADQVVVIGSDGRLGLVAVDRNTGAIAVLGTEAVEVLTTGSPTEELLALSAAHAVVRTCSPECITERIDRDTGERTLVEVPDNIEAQVATRSARQRLVENTVSPDGTMLLVLRSDRPSTWLAVELDTGESFEVGSIRTGTRVVWSADSAAAVFQTGEEIRVLDRGGRQVVELSEPPPVAGFAER